jgi:hypothetical protein
MYGKGYLSGVVTNFKRRYLPQGRHNPSFLGTMCKGEAHGDFDLQTMPSDSNLLNSALAFCNFCGSRRRDFAKKGGGLATGMDVMLYPVVRCRLHIPGAPNGGEFLQ